MRTAEVAGALVAAFAVPAIALAQSSVTVSGFIKVGLENLSVGDAVARANTSENRLVDNLSRIDFNVREDLGAGLSAVGLFDVRYSATTGAGGATGNAWVGLNSTRWGRIVLGRADLHYYHTADTIPAGATAVDAWSIALLSYVQCGSCGGGGASVNASIANGTRTPNVVEYSSPHWGLFAFGLAYSTDSYGNTGSMTPGPTDTTQKAHAWNFAPQLNGGNWVAGYSYWEAQAPAASTTLPDQRSDRVWGYYSFPRGFRLGLTWDKSRLQAAAGGARLAERSAWSLPLAYHWGPSAVGWTHTVAGDDKVIGSNSGAKLDAIYYEYRLSKRTQVGVTYMRLSNDAKAAYSLFLSGSSGVATSDGASQLGEDFRALQLTLMHSF